MFSKHVAYLKQLAEQALAKDPDRIAGEAADRMRTTSAGLTVGGLKPELYFEKRRASEPENFNPRHIVPAKDFKKDFFGNYHVTLDGQDRVLTESEFKDRRQFNTADPEKPTWYVEFYE
jgi:hypothetical protein